MRIVEAFPRRSVAGHDGQSTVCLADRSDPARTARATTRRADLALRLAVAEWKGRRGDAADDQDAGRRAELGP
jgi:hypothetical protein